MSEFAEYYKKTVPIGKADVAVGKDILYGSGKHYFWITNPDYRVLVDTFQGGSIGDLRPYAGKYESFTGVDSELLVMNSYPYIIQSQYRSGFKNHYVDGSRTTLLVEHGGETKDMCEYPSKVQKVNRVGEDVELCLTPVEMVFGDGFSVKLQTAYTFKRGGQIIITRNVLERSDAKGELKLTEYLKGCYGFTEYPEKMKGIKLTSGDGESFDYQYADRNLVTESGREVSVSIPQITTEVVLSALTPADSTEIADGTLFSPFYTMKINYTLKDTDKEVSTCLQIRKMKE